MIARKILPLALLFLSCLLPAHAEAAGCVHRLGIAAGAVLQEKPSRTNFSMGAEYECRASRYIGLGAFGGHIFSDPSTTILGAPQLILHPFGWRFFVAGSPIVELGPYGTNFGVRVSTRLPVPFGLFFLVPSFSVDFIRGQRSYWFGLGLFL